MGSMEMELCRFFNMTPSQIGELRRKDPLGISFIERRILYEVQQKIEMNKKLEREYKKAKGKSRHGKIGR